MSDGDVNNILGQLFSGGTALAGLVLVFLGGILASYDGYEPTDRPAVVSQYRRRAWAAFWGFIGAIVAGASGLAGLVAGGSKIWLCIGLAALAVSAIVLVVMAVLSVKEIA